MKKLVVTENRESYSYFLMKNNLSQRDYPYAPDNRLVARRGPLLFVGAYEKNPDFHPNEIPYRVFINAERTNLFEPYPKRKNKIHEEIIYDNEW